MDVVPLSVGIASRSWDDQHLDLVAASGQVAAAPVSGFTGPVSGAASRFTSSWERVVETLGTQCETRADGLRSAIRDYVSSDEAQAAGLFLLSSYLVEQR